MTTNNKLWKLPEGVEESLPLRGVIAPATLDDKGLRTIGLLSMLGMFGGLAALQLIHWLA